jgi:Bax protein
MGPATEDTSGPLRVALEAIPLVVVVLTAAFWLINREPAATSSAPAPAAPSPDLEPIAALDVSGLEATFDAHGYRWPPEGTVPRIAVASLPAGLGAQSPERRKAIFLRALLPLVLAENELIRREKAMLQRLLQEEGALTETQRQNLDQLRARYGVGGSLPESSIHARLKRRIDTVPPALALAQAALETGWGTSRFAREGNNLFGEWTWHRNRGMKPRESDPGARHFVRRFPGLQVSVRAYLRNINTHAAYRRLRAIRARVHGLGQRLTGAELAAGLTPYSERGQAYVADIRNIIRQNRLDAITMPLRLRGNAD